MSTNRGGREIVTLPNLDAVSHEAAERFVSLASAAIGQSGRFTVALAGGSTPERLYKLLAASPYRERVRWNAVHLFFGDERTVPPDDAQSNYRMAKRSLLDAVPEAHVYRMEGEREPHEAAASYDTVLREQFVGQNPPRFDLILLGMGPDGHTASLFPHTDALDVTATFVVANYVAKMDTWRLTLTYPVLNAAAQVLFLVGGADKAPAVREVVQGASNCSEYPSQGVLPSDGTVTFLLDPAAAAQVV